MSSDSQTVGAYGLKFGSYPFSCDDATTDDPGFGVTHDVLKVAGQNLGQVVTLVRLLYGKEFPAAAKAYQAPSDGPGSIAGESQYELAKKARKLRRRVWIGDGADGTLDIHDYTGRHATCRP